MRKKKKCEEPGCITILSYYNESKYCFCHSHSFKDADKIDYLPLYGDVGADVGATVDRFFNIAQSQYNGRVNERTIGVAPLIMNRF